MPLLHDRQEPYGAECQGDSFCCPKEEIRVHLTTKVHLIPLPGEEPLTQPPKDSALQDEEEIRVHLTTEVHLIPLPGEEPLIQPPKDSALQDEEDIPSTSQLEQLSPQIVFHDTHNKQSMEDLEANGISHCKSSKFEKRKKLKEESHHRIKSPADCCSLPSSESIPELLPHAPMPVLEKRFTCLQALHNPPKPNIFGYQLIGDSMLVRFAQQVLKEPPMFAESLRFLGYCVSGQRIGDLLRRLKSGFYHIGNKVVLMIGTCDLCKNSQAEQMIHELQQVLEHLCTKAEKIVVLTLPPVPRNELYTHHWTILNKYNNFIRTLNNKGPSLVSHLDISNLFCNKRISKCRMDCFELTFSKYPYRKDLIHLNRKGLMLLKEALYKLE